MAARRRRGAGRRPSGAARASRPRKKPSGPARKGGQVGRAPTRTRREALDLWAIERKWQRAWAEARTFEAAPDPSRPKWFSNVPYPYMSGYQHLGFGLSFMRAEFQSRYRRMAGYNVLHPQAFHCTGLPILGAAKRVASGEPQQIEILRGMGVSDDEIPKFAEPLHWIEVFPAATMEDLRRLGAAVDWRRSFITTPLNPPYDAFVRWQFRRLRERGFVRIDKHPVVWCPKDQAPIGDHDRLEGEGETPVVYTLLKFPLPDGRLLVAATIRPETVFGQTNVWVDPGAEYVEARVDGERWILNELAVSKLLEQGVSVAVVSRLRGADLVGKDVVAPAINRAVLVLPGAFIDQGRGTGIVTSVPSDAPDDFVALRDLQADEALMAKYRLDPARVRAIQPVPIIRTPGWGPLPGVEIVERMGIRSQHDREKLERAKAEVYRSGFYTGVMNENCGSLSGVRVEVAKEEIRRQLLESRQAGTMYEPSGEVICRCTTRAIVKVVADQWFLAYGDPAWKAKVHEAVNGMALHPEGVRKQFEYVIDWLQDWPCAHHRGLGTKLPWDDDWVIESLSDSTLYMAYYTIAHVLQGGSLRSTVPWATRLDDGFFDYVFLGEGDPSGIADRLGIPRSLLEDLRREFLYWYPFDLRNTGKDLVPNHMTFCLFNHTAMFPRDLWPRGYGINGYVQMLGRKMSKSRGNVWYIRHALEEWPADVLRLTIANAGDGQDDPNIDLDFASTASDRLRDWFAFATKPPRVAEDARTVDAWFLSVLNRAVGAARESMESMNYKAALRHAYFDLQTAWAWYMRRRKGRPQREVLLRFVDVQTRLLAPFTPHLSEEIWQRLGNSDLIARAPYPETMAEMVDSAAEAGEALLQSTIADVREIVKVTGLRPRRIALYTAAPWKARVREIAFDLIRSGGLSVGALVQKALAEPGMRERASEVSAYAKKVADELRHAKPADLDTRPPSLDEQKLFEENREFLRGELGAAVEVFLGDDPRRWDPKKKGGQAVPGRPAIYLE